MSSVLQRYFVQGTTLITITQQILNITFANAGKLKRLCILKVYHRVCISNISFSYNQGSYELMLLLFLTLHHILFVFHVAEHSKSNFCLQMARILIITIFQ